VKRIAKKPTLLFLGDRLSHASELTASDANVLNDCLVVPTIACVIVHRHFSVTRNSGSNSSIVMPATNEAMSLFHPGNRKRRLRPGLWHAINSLSSPPFQTFAFFPTWPAVNYGFPRQGTLAVLLVEEIARVSARRWREEPSILCSFDRNELKEYFAGKDTHSLHRGTACTTFQKEVWEVLLGIPYGEPALTATSQSDWKSRSQFERGWATV